MYWIRKENGNIIILVCGILKKSLISITTEVTQASEMPNDHQSCGFMGNQTSSQYEGTVLPDIPSAEGKCQKIL